MRKLLGDTHPMMRSVAILFLALIAAAHAQTVTPNTFGMNFHSNTLQQKVQFATCRLFNATDGLPDDVSWAQIETARGTYNWANLDAVVNLCLARGAMIIYTFANVPGWANGNAAHYVPPTSFADLYNFQAAVVARYAGDGIYYDAWNEADLPTNWWSGTQAQMLSVAQNLYSLAGHGVGSLDQTSYVTTPSAAASGGFLWMQGYLALGGGSYADVLNIHCYPIRGPGYSSIPPVSAPESVQYSALHYLSMYQQYGVSGKPLICSEGGWATYSISGLTTPQEQAYAALWQILWLGEGWSSISWYEYDDSVWGTLWDGGTWLAPPGIAFREAQKWLAGATFTSAPARIAKTNGVRNPSMAGSVAGTPGTPPTDMSVNNPDSGHGITTTIVGSGTEGGVPYVDWQVSGTATTGASGYVQFSFEASNQIAASIGQQWTSCVYVKLQSGTTANVSNVVMQTDENNSSGTYLDLILYDFFYPSGAPLNYNEECFATTTANSSVAYVLPQIAIYYPVGSAINLTLRLGSPSMDTGSQWSAAISKTGGYTATIAWDAGGGPSGFATTQPYYRDLNGSGHPVVAGSVSLTNLPIILESSQWSGLLQ